MKKYIMGECQYGKWGEQEITFRSFGKRSTGSARRPNECLILEPSEMIVIDYPDVAVAGRGGNGATSRPVTGNSKSLEKGLDVTDSTVVRPRLYSNEETHPYHHGPHHLYQSHFPPDLPPVHTVLSRHDYIYPPSHHSPHVGGGPHGSGSTKSNRSSHSSDTSSAYSGSDTMQSVQSSLEGDVADEVDLSGLVESVVDSDEDEDLAESVDSLTVRDTVRECLEKDPTDRTDDDVEILLEITQHLKAFNNMTLAVRRALCSVMVFAVVEKAGTIVMNDGEELDSWSVVINGHVDVETKDGEVQNLHLGDSFGITPTMEKLYHRGVMRTKCDDCQFVCITQTDYYRILHQGEENQRRHTDSEGRLVLVTEHRVLDGSSRRGHIVIRGSPDKLMSQLVEENSIIDLTYVEDFLLMYRSFIDSPSTVSEQLLKWFAEACYRDRVTRVVLLWVNNHFTDFETDPAMMEFLETFEGELEREKMTQQLRLLNIACASKAKTRTVTLARPSRDEVLHFSVLGGYERGFGIFVSKVEKGSKAEDVGLKRGDQILEVNGQSFEHVSHARALEILRSTTHLSVTVKSNLLAFKEMLNTPENSPRPRPTRKASNDLMQQHLDPKLTARLSVIDLGATTPDAPSDPPSKETTVAKVAQPATQPSGKGFMTLGHKTRLRKVIKNLMPKNIINDGVSEEEVAAAVGTVAVTAGATSALPAALYHSQSNPDLSSMYYDELRHADYPEHVLKVYKADQTCKYLLIHKETTAREVVMLALQEFGITDPSSNYSLCEVSVSENGFVKQKRLHDQLQNLAERIGISSRYYLKNNQSTETLVPDELAPELVKESLVHFLQLNAVEVAVQLTLVDFSIFRQIESTEYVDDLFEIKKSKYGTPMLSQFAELVNREMFWVVTEICSEHNLVRRMKMVKQFVKVARQCKECHNFNSMFAIISGLGHGAVSRLRYTWEKLPSKYQRLFTDMQELMDPSRNMAKYRNLLNSEHVRPPMIPFYPVVKKDQTFIHLGNDTKVEGLVNFEKLRMIAKEIRSLRNMCSVPYNLVTMCGMGGHPSTAMVALNQLTAGGMAISAAPGPQNIATVKRRKKSTAAPNPKKMFEEAQMVRRVKAYLNNMKVITDEDVLRQMSLECEPAPGSSSSTANVTVQGPVAAPGGSSSQPAARRRHPSPTLSTASSASGTSATSGASEGRRTAVGSNGGTGKFGAASPQSLRKMLSLSEAKTRIYQGRQPPPPPASSSPSNGFQPPTAYPSHLHHYYHPAHVSPSPSPPSNGIVRGRAGSGGAPVAGRQGGHTHERSHSDTPSPGRLMFPIVSVDLSAESSSVTSLSNSHLHKKQTSAGSATSSDSSSVGSYPPHRPLNYETDSGHSSSTSANSSSVGANGRGENGNSSPGTKRRFAAPNSSRTRPPFPHSVPVLPPLPPNLHLGAASRQHNRLLGRRANSHEGVSAAYRDVGPEQSVDDDDEETQVSAV